MRHTISTTIDIEAPPEAVWEVLVDLDRHTDWNPFIISASGDVAAGNRLDLRMQPPGGRGMRFRPRVTVADGHVLEWLGHLGVRGLFDGRHRFELHPTPGGGTRLVHGETFTGILVRLLARSLDGGTRAGFEQMNAALRERVLARSAA